MSKILIVEDEESIAELEKDYLELSGFEVEIANDGSEGLERAFNEEFNLIILDLMLPGAVSYTHLTEANAKQIFFICKAKASVFLFYRKKLW